ncbi:rnd family efflux transporter mfp subunit : RND family efflux transporter, MFP subunit OS=Singulisphaera acidiphila (strain ATCC BAA-1392 / DSM 18658 / VKM B-2454 / MOB10) GN=Sinac_0100 PE=4 SV=1: HlyD_2 [Gemmata massiliana]|uniref:Multidrug resistance protein MdtA-like barrel-sandwich hybrid domain-containing protein n=1 Tax=Gemmata massiliana TaxID=1210884 RepID=A0A6P2D421_9BACT|nr:efflux RND transporter periplasmic adaptor subunit [Gemmata massiliana]VTR95833.1 rnd family efflux transporter mfp subunit : RND family efflux transporter, MFP subunit OS=Singulisphaera acidiphila (strain ATCC BAA-1392 / DSM 18658 / VKM B-2454 / MOB10) GN=Sinac_0100 PE=4 SV=1: HlyD_2 [Gemmata massiliana]
MTHTPKHFRWSRLALLALVVAGVAGGGWFAVARGKPLFDEKAHAEEPKTAPQTTAEVVSPHAGGIDRVCVQPGTVEPLESADLCAKVSGFLIEQTVDIGSAVKKGDVLARIAVPEYQKQTERDRARVTAAEAKVRQMEAHVTAAESESKSAEASVALANVLVRAKKAYRQYREKQLNRFRELAAQKAIEQRVVDEQEDYYLAAFEGENEAKEAVRAAIERLATAKAKIAQAKADVEQAKAEVGVATADLERTQVFLDYAVIRSPYTGVVTRRTFHVGDFVKSADQGAAQPLLSVTRTDVMRVVIQVPDRDVPYVTVGDPAAFEVGAPDLRIKFATRGISRLAKVQDPATRMMRVEVDVDNPTDANHPDGVLYSGAYGHATLTLQVGAPNAVRVPTIALSNRSPGKGSVRVMHGDRIQTVPVTIGSDNGVEAEVLTGLTPVDRVVLRVSNPVDDGAVVATTGAKVATAAH